MTDRPILFSGAMVRAILDGRKTQTRRVVKPQPGEGDAFEPCGHVLRGVDYEGLHAPVCDIVCPYGQPGDRLWVREAWAVEKCLDGIKPRDIEPYVPVWYCADATRPTETNGDPIEWGKTRPNIHIPRWASRLTLEVVSVRVERVQDITEADTVAEGVDEWPEFKSHTTKWCKTHYPAYSDDGVCVEPGWCDCQDHSIKEIFGLLWDSINAKRGFGWDANPWVWVVEFRRLDA